MKIITDAAEAQQLQEAGEPLVPFIGEVADEDGDMVPQLCWRTWTRPERWKDRHSQQKKNRRGRGPLPMFQPRYQQRREQIRGQALNFAMEIKQRRQALGLTQQQLADASGFDRVYIAYIEGGQRLATKPQTRQKIRAALQQAQVGRVQRFVAALNDQKVAA